MFDLKVLIQKELEEQKQLEKLYYRKLQTLPEGLLSVTEKKGTCYYSRHIGGERFYLGKEGNEINKLKARKLLTEATARIKANEKLMKKFLSSYQDVSLDSIEASLSKAYKSDGGDVFVTLGIQNYKNWGSKKYEKDTRYPEALVHRTLKGEFVRSKSEVIIANSYFTKNIQYRYEELTQIGKYTFAPDFKVLVPGRRKIKFHEHFGMMHDPAYRERALWKISMYIENGYRPYEDIIFTFDDLDGNIDTKNLDTLINSFCL